MLTQYSIILIVLIITPYTNCEFECHTSQSCASCNLSTGKCDQLCRYNYYWDPSSVSCKKRTLVVDDCISYKNFDKDDGICDNCLIAYTLYINQTTDPIEYNCERTEAYWTCLDNCRYCAVVQKSDKTWHKYCLGCSIGYIGTEFNATEKWTTKCGKGQCSENCRNCTMDNDGFGQRCVACTDRYMIDANNNISCL